VLLHCNFEEVTALSFGARSLLDAGADGEGVVAAPPASLAAVEALLPELVGDLSLDTLGEQRRVELAVVTIVDFLRLEVESAVLATHPAHEQAVSAYFDFAHTLSVLGRVREIGREMEAVIELVTGREPDAALLRTFYFPD